jgi:hypothetical protein
VGDDAYVPSKWLYLSMERGPTESDRKSPELQVGENMISVAFCGSPFGDIRVKLNGNEGVHLEKLVLGDLRNWALLACQALEFRSCNSCMCAYMYSSMYTYI